MSGEGVLLQEPELRTGGARWGVKGGSLGPRCPSVTLMAWCWFRLLGLAFLVGARLWS